LGFVWVGARIAYGVGYRQAPEKRGPAFGLAFLASFTLWVMAAEGVVLARS
jgi:glutathione S-transferase